MRLSLKELEKNSLADLLRTKTKNELSELLSKYSDVEIAEIYYDWKTWARKNQLPPKTEWRIWLILAGRGFGKTRTGGEWMLEQMRKGKRRMALIAPTAADCRDVMVEGESGILNIAPPWEKPLYEPSKRRLTFPNGAIASTYSGDEPERLRGPQFDAAWVDELAAFKYADRAWDNLMFGLRLGNDPRACVTTTPKPIKIIKQLINSNNIVVSKGTTYENRENLAEAFYTEIIDKYKETRIGRQELHAEILDDNPEALWQRDNIETHRVLQSPDLVRVVVGVDPATTKNENSSETGIIVAGIDQKGHGYVLDDLSIKGSPKEWASSVITGYYKHKGDKIIGENNQGGDMVANTISTVDPKVPVKMVRATRGKYTRAEPIASLYEQGKIHHVGMFATLEDQLCEWTPGDNSPDRLDALVWAFTELMLNKKQRPKVKPTGTTGASGWRI